MLIYSSRIILFIIETGWLNRNEQSISLKGRCMMIMCKGPFFLIMTIERAQNELLIVYVFFSYGKVYSIINTGDIFVFRHNMIIKEVKNNEYAKYS